MSNVLNEGALDANRQGRLTLIQILGLLPFILMGGILFLVGGGIGGGIIYAIVTHTLKGSIVAAVLIGGGISIAILWLAYVLGGAVLLDVLIGRVVYIDGPARKTLGFGSSSGSVVRLYCVGDQDFQIPFISSATWKRMPDGHAVRAYYIPLSKRLVNIDSHPSRGG